MELSEKLKCVRRKLALGEEESAPTGIPNIQCTNSLNLDAVPILFEDNVLLAQDGTIIQNVPVIEDVSAGECVQVVPPVEEVAVVQMVSDGTLDTRSIRIPIANKQRIRHFCKFCETTVSNFARHICTVHDEETEVIRLLGYPAGSEERKNMLTAIRKEGDYLFNTDKRFRTNILNVSRRPRTDTDADDYLACPWCKGFYSKFTLRIHLPRCPHNQHEKGKRDILVQGRRITRGIHPKACETLRRFVFPPLFETEGVKIARYDELIILYANKLCKKYKQEHHYAMIRTEIRILGKFLVELKAVNDTITSLKKALTPEYYDIVIETVKKLGKYDETTDRFGAPTTSMNLATTIRKCADILISECIKEQNIAKKNKVEDFKKLLLTDLNSAVTATALESLTYIKRMKKSVLPTTNSIKIFNEFLLAKQKQNYLQLQEKFVFETWKELGATTLVFLLSLNRRRAGEIERMKIEDFKNYDTLQDLMNDPMYKTFVEAGSLEKKYRRITLRGKLGRTVPVLLPLFCYQCCELFLENRKNAKVPDKNPYVFGIPGSQLTFSYLRACEYMRRYSKECNVPQPELLRGTNLRKHIATLSKAQNLDEDTVTDLANHMGHTEATHRKVYRLPLATRELAVMPKLLEGAAGFTDSHEDSRTEEMRATNKTPDCLDDDEESTEQCSDRTKILKIHVRREEVDDFMKKNKCANEQDDFDVGSPFCSTPEKHMTTSTETEDENNIKPFIARRTWATPEKNVIRSELKSLYDRGSLPPLPLCRKLIEKHPILKNRTPAQIKAFVNNEQRKKPSTMCKRPAWLTPEKLAVRQYFKKHIITKTVPTLKECEQALNENPKLYLRKPVSIRSWIMREIEKDT